MKICIVGRNKKIFGLFGFSQRIDIQTLLN